MAEGNCTSVDVQPWVVVYCKAELLHKCHGLNSKSFVQFDEPNIVNGETCYLKCLVSGGIVRCP